MNKATTIRLPDNLKIKLKEKSIAEGVTLNALIINVCWRYLHDMA